MFINEIVEPKIIEIGKKENKTIKQLFINLLGIKNYKIKLIEKYPDLSGYFLSLQFI